MHDTCGVLGTNSALLDTFAADVRSGTDTVYVYVTASCYRCFLCSTSDVRPSLHLSRVSPCLTLLPLPVEIPHSVPAADDEDERADDGRTDIPAVVVRLIQTDEVSLIVS